MRLSFYSLEAARSNPRRYATKLSSTKGAYNANNFRTYFATALRAYHSGGNWSELLAAFTHTCRRKLNSLQYFEQRLANYERTLRSYLQSYATQRCQFVEMEKKVVLTLGRHVVAGKVDRFDIRIPRGYQGTDIQLRPANWKRQLRWPLIQIALATELGASSAEVEVGVHCFETGVPDYKIFEHVEIDQALEEAEQICDEIEEAQGDLEDDGPLS